MIPLTDSQRRAIRRLVIGGWTIEAIADHMGIAEDRVKRVLIKAGLFRQEQKGPIYHYLPWDAEEKDLTDLQSEERRRSNAVVAERAREEIVNGENAVRFAFMLVSDIEQQYGVDRREAQRMCERGWELMNMQRRGQKREVI